MDDSKQAWSDVGERFGALGTRLREHGRRAAGGAPTAQPDKAAVLEALDTLGRALDQALGAASHAVKDPAVRDELKGALDAMGDALNVTFAEVGEKAGETLRTAGDKVADTIGRKPPEPPV